MGRCSSHVLRGGEPRKNPRHTRETLSSGLGMARNWGSRNKWPGRGMVGHLCLRLLPPQPRWAETKNWLQKLKNPNLLHIKIQQIYQLWPKSAFFFSYIWATLVLPNSRCWLCKSQLGPNGASWLPKVQRMIIQQTSSPHNKCWCLDWASSADVYMLFRWKYSYKFS